MKFAGPYINHQYGLYCRPLIWNNKLDRSAYVFYEYLDRWVIEGSELQSHCKEKVMDTLDKWLIQSGVKILSQEDFNKYLVLL